MRTEAEIKARIALTQTLKKENDGSMNDHTLEMVIKELKWVLEE